jgi:hypothetical protein
VPAWRLPLPPPLAHVAVHGSWRGRGRQLGTSNFSVHKLACLASFMGRHGVRPLRSPAGIGPHWHLYLLLAAWMCQADVARHSIRAVPPSQTGAAVSARSGSMVHVGRRQGAHGPGGGSETSDELGQRATDSTFMWRVVSCRTQKDNPPSPPFLPPAPAPGPCFTLLAKSGSGTWHHATCFRGVLLCAGPRWCIRYRRMMWGAGARSNDSLQPHVTMWGAGFQEP